MSIWTSLRRVRGLGTAKDGVHHWWVQRLTAVALVPLSIWFVTSIVLLAGSDHARVTAWIANPVVAVFLMLTLIAMFYHLKLGLQVVIEDYIHAKPTKFACLLLNNFGNTVLALSCIVSVLKIAV